jgi:DNA mismatch repair protein MSH6
MDDFVVPDDSDEEVAVPQKRKRVMQKAPKSKSRSVSPLHRLQPVESDGDVDMDKPAGTSTAQQWTYDPDNLEPTHPRPTQVAKPASSAKKAKPKAHATEPEKRHPWLANRLDADRNPTDHPDYDHRTLYIPPGSLNQLSPFEQQYWKIKSKFMDTVVFFKKGKFYELYEDDATIGHQHFDLKLTDRVNMRMVGVPESSLDHWANQFVAKGHKIARVDQMESALGKEMRERDDTSKKAKKEEKVIRRELAAVLTSGTLVDGGMLQDDMSTYCVAIKVSFHAFYFHCLYSC